jgi:hypothetical protein
MKISDDCLMDMDDDWERTENGGTSDNSFSRLRPSVDMIRTSEKEKEKLNFTLVNGCSAYLIIIHKGM